ncbi:MAG: ABC transporter ATP-binding protein, partial [Clostridiales bacterium]|nr:ABC transporter ATP-binding protein [Clostridiales bacterium]
MSKILEVKDLCKEYPSFKLDNVSFAIEEGTIMGFIGRNGAGKSTTLKSILNIVHPNSGSVTFFGKDFFGNEKEIKEQIGFVGGAVDYYKKKKIADIVKVTKKFYKEWNDEAYKKYMDVFELDEKKTPAELSEGMKVKFNLVLALSHNAKL